MPVKPDLFIVGAPKSGTTSMYEYLADHPEIYMSPNKEPMYFCPDIVNPQRDPLHFADDESRYLDLYAGARSEKRRGEATTRYLVSRRAPALIRDFQANAFIVVMLRNPIDMVYALHGERVLQGHEAVTDFAAALATDQARLSDQDGPGEAEPQTPGYRETAHYGDQLEHWLGVFGRDRLHVIVFDDFTRDTAAELARLLEFLDVDPSYRPPSLTAHNAAYQQRAAVRRVLDSRMGEWITHDFLGRLIGPNARASLALRFRQSRFNRRPASRSPLSAGLRASLEEDLRPDVTKLSEILDRDLVSLWFK